MYEETRKYLKLSGEQLSKEMQTRLKGYNKTATKNLYNSIKPIVWQNQYGIGLKIQMEDYGKFVDKGVEGSESGKAGKGGRSPYKYTNKMPPMNLEFLRWMHIRNINPKFSFVIRRKIFKRGVTPTNFFTTTVSRNEKRIETGIKNAMKKDIETILNGTNNN